MSKSKQTKYQLRQAPRRPGRSLDLKPLDFEHRFIDDHLRTATGGKLKTNSLMSKSSQTKYQPKQAPRRPARSLDLKPLDFEHRFIDDLKGSRGLDSCRLTHYAFTNS